MAFRMSFCLLLAISILLVIKCVLLRSIIDEQNILINRFKLHLEMMKSINKPKHFTCGEYIPAYSAVVVGPDNKIYLAKTRDE